MGKSALLGYVAERGADWHVARAVGVESEMELAYAGLHQAVSRRPEDSGADRQPVQAKEVDPMSSEPKFVPSRSTCLTKR